MAKHPSIAYEYDTLNLGCGNVKILDALNVDLVASVKPDMVIDLERLPYPLPDDQFTRVICQDVIEHLSDVVATMEELVRVSKNGAVMIIRVPHFSSSNAYTDITHQHFFGIQSMDYFTEDGEYNFYTKARVKVIKHELTFPPNGLSFLGRFIHKRWWRFWEANLHGIIPADNLTFTLEVVK